MIVASNIPPSDTNSGFHISFRQKFNVPHARMLWKKEIQVLRRENHGKFQIFGHIFPFCVKSVRQKDGRAKFTRSQIGELGWSDKCCLRCWLAFTYREIAAESYSRHYYTWKNWDGWADTTVETTLELDPKQFHCLRAVCFSAIAPTPPFTCVRTHTKANEGEISTSTFTGLRYSHANWI